MGTFTAIFMHSTLVAPGVMRARQQAGLQVPGDLALLGHGDYGFAPYFAVPLTCVRNPAQEMAERAADRATSVLGNEEESAAMVQDTAQQPARESVITEEMRTIQGKELHVLSEEVERGAIRRFVEAVEDPNPLYLDEVYARGTKHGGIIAPPTFVSIIGHLRKGGEKNRPPMPYKRPYEKAMHASDDWEFFAPVHLGDTITMRHKIADFYEKQGKKGNLLFTVQEIEYFNQLGQLVARVRETGVSFP